MVLSENECFSEVYIGEFRIKDVNNYAGNLIVMNILRE
jgi:hypothetical protein